MSRFMLIASFVLAVSSLASAERVSAPHFAQPPSAPAANAAPARSEPDEEPMVFDRTAVRDALVRARQMNLDRFVAYQKTGVFPSNTFDPRRLNVWRDRDGHLCAAATMIDGSGAHDLVKRTAEQTNFIRLADVKQGPLMDWILTSGFTQDEIAAIQEPFDPVFEKPSPSIDADLRAKENQRLAAKYKTVTAMLRKNAAASIEAATDRLMKRPELAAQLVTSQAL
jgi:hypothetical protein